MVIREITLGELMFVRETLEHLEELTDYQDRSTQIAIDLIEAIINYKEPVTCTNTTLEKESG